MGNRRRAEQTLDPVRVTVGPRQIRVGSAIFGPRPGPPFDWARAAAAAADAESDSDGGAGGVLLAGR